MTCADCLRASGLSAAPSNRACANPWIEVSGVLSSCDTFATKSRCERRLDSTRLIIALKARVRSRTSWGPDSGTGWTSSAPGSTSPALAPDNCPGGAEDTPWAAVTSRCSGLPIQRAKHVCQHQRQEQGNQATFQQGRRQLIAQQTQGRQHLWPRRGDQQRCAIGLLRPREEPQSGCRCPEPLTGLGRSTPRA